MKSIVLLFLVFLSLVCFAQWQVLPSNTTADLSEIRFISADTGFTCGHDGALLETYNGGSSWTALNAGSGDFDFIEAVNRDTIILAGPDGLYRTFDGGSSWEHLLAGTPMFDLSYSDAGYLFFKTSWIDTCISASEFSTTTRYHNYISPDLGSSYGPNQGMSNSAGQRQFLKDGIGFNLSGYGFYDPAGWHCEKYDIGVVYYTIDGGLSWSPNNMSGYICGPLYPGWFLNDKTGFAEQSREEYGDSFILKTTDGTINFDVFSLTNLTQLTDMAFINENVGYALKDNIIYKLSFLNNLFTGQAEYISGSILKDITIGPDNMAYVAGENGIILSKQLDPYESPDSLYFISLSEDQIQFAYTAVGASRIEEFTISANGNLPVSLDLESNEIFQVKLTGSSTFADTIPTFILQPTKDTIVQVKFTPADYLDYTHDLAIHTNASGDTVLFVHLMGKGIPYLSGTISEDTTLCVKNISIVGDVIIEDSVTVTICPGTTLDFTGPYKFVVNGALHAEGTANDSIYFTSHEGNEGWKGLQINGSENPDSTILSFCMIENGYNEVWDGGVFSTGITVRNHERFSLRNCEIRNNNNFYEASALKLSNSTVDIRNNSIHHNISNQFRHTIEIDSTTGIMRNNFIYSNTGMAIYFEFTGQDFMLLQNLIINNEGSFETNGTSAISLNYSSPGLILNTIYHNYSSDFGQAIEVYNDSDPAITGNIIYGNFPEQIAVSNYYPACYPVVTYNDIEDDWANGGNINAAPGFIYPSPEQVPIDNYQDYDFRITAYSACYNAGTNEIPIVPEKDLAGLSRIYKGIIDIGAYEAHFFEQLGPRKACTGDTVQLTVTPVEPPPYEFTWRFNGDTISTITGNQLVLNNIDNSNEGLYECTVTTGGDTLYTSGFLTVYAPPVILTEPADISTCIGQPIFATAEVSGRALSYEWIDYLTGDAVTSADTFFINTQSPGSGSYFCRISNLCGEAESSVFTADVWPDHAFDLGKDTTINSSSSIILDAGEGAASYLWITGEETQAIVVNGNDYNPGVHQFWVRVESAGHSCISSDTINIEIINDYNIEEIENDIVKIFPNPSVGDLVVCFQQEYQESEAEFMIHDLTGRLICEYRIMVPEGGQVQLPRGCLKQGIYLIQITTGHFSITRKIVIL